MVEMYQSDVRPTTCRFRLQDEGKAYPRSSCPACHKTITTGLGKRCDAEKAALLSVATLQSEIAALKAENERLREALTPFSTFADDNVEFVPFDPLKMQHSFCWNSNAVKNDRIFEWFGPSDFGNARAALQNGAAS